MTDLPQHLTKIQCVFVLELRELQTVEEIDLDIEEVAVVNNGRSVAGGKKGGKFESQKSGSLVPGGPGFNPHGGKDNRKEEINYDWVSRIKYIAAQSFSFLFVALCFIPRKKIDLAIFD